MENMTAFFQWILTSVANFLASEPIIYFVGVFLLVVIIQAVKMIIKN